MVNARIAKIGSSFSHVGNRMAKSENRHATEIFSLLK